MSTTPQLSYPDFDELPVDKNGPGKNAWGLWGADDQLGTLNHLTDEIIARAAKEEIRTGQRVSLNWSMTGPSNPRFVRGILQLRTINKAPTIVAHDDEWTFNSQCSSQWDGFRHYGYQAEELYYMGRTADDFAKSPIPSGIQHVAKKGIAGRVIFVDWYTWATERKQVVDALSDQAIPFDELVQAAQAQGLSLEDEVRAGDILLVRSGYLAQYESLDGQRREHLDGLYKTRKPENIGVQPSRELLSFLWRHRVAAVAGDSRSFERWPCRDPEWHLHEWLLAGWGMPIGELFDLEELSRVCATHRRYTFFLSSSPANVPGAVASPPNAIAFF